MNIWEEQLKKRQAKYPTENFVRFVARNYYDVPDRSSVRFLDCGCGAGANSDYLRGEGFSVLAIDSAENSKADIMADVCTWAYPLREFDCVLDNNTLCHVKYPPIYRVHASLKDGGKMFSVAPANDTWRGHLEGKDYCRCSANDEMRDLFHVFSNVQIGYACYPQDGHTISSWIVEATK